MIGIGEGYAKKILMMLYFTKSMLESIDEGIYFVDTQRRITFWNNGAEIISGFVKEEMIDRFCYDNILNHVSEQGQRLCHNGCPLHKTLIDGDERKVIVYLHHKDGHRVKILTRVFPIYEENKIVGAVEIFREISESSIKHVEYSENYSPEELKILAPYDQLTGLPNRRFLESFLNSKIMEFETLEIPFGVLFIDIDDFRNFNNTHGHELGDKVLKAVAKTFASAIRKSDVIGRCGGEEFVGIFPAVSISQLDIIGEKYACLQSILF